MPHDKPYKKDRPGAAAAADCAADKRTAAAEEQAQAEAGAEQQPAAEQAAAAESEADRQTDQVAGLRAELDQVKDHALRCQAELENYRKRVHRQMEDERRYANLPLLRDLLPVLDNVHRAIEAAEKSPDLSALLEGFKLVAGQLEGVLARHHCLPIQSLHQPFDPHLHEAIAQQPSQEFPANTVLMVTQAGFQLHDRVVRPSQVIVSANSE